MPSEAETSTAVEEERAFLLRSIVDLDAEYAAGDLDEADYRTLRDDYVARAAALLRSVSTSAHPPDTSAHRRGGAWRRVAIVAAVLAAAVGAGVAVATTAGERVGDAQATGSLPEASTDRIARAQLLVRQGEILEAIKVYDDLLADDPENPVALAERGWLISRVDASLVDRGLQSIDAALEVDPAFAEAHFFRGMILLQHKNDAAGAAAAFESALAADPPADVRSAIEAALEQARSRASATP